jgi:hypothetical protein
MQEPTVVDVVLCLHPTGYHDRRKWLQVGADFVPDREAESGYTRLIPADDMLIELHVDTIDRSLEQSGLTYEAIITWAGQVLSEKQVSFLPILRQAMTLAEPHIGYAAIGDDPLICYQLNQNGKIVTGPLFFVWGYDYYPIPETDVVEDLAQTIVGIVHEAQQEEKEMVSRTSKDGKTIH